MLRMEVEVVVLMMKKEIEGRTNCGTCRVHGIIQSAGFHKALDSSYLSGDAGSWGSNLSKPSIKAEALDPRP